MPRNGRLKFAIRSLRNNPGFTLLAVIVMALGIGANTAVFSVVNTVLLKPLAFKDPERIVTIRNQWQKSATPGSLASAPDFHDWHDQSSAFDAMAFYTQNQTAVQVGGASDYGKGDRAFCNAARRGRIADPKFSSAHGRR